MSSLLSLPQPQLSSQSSLNFRLILRCDYREQYLNIPSFQEISHLHKIGLKKANLKESDIVACINVQRLRVLRINGKLRDQINNGDTIWYVTKADWDAYVKIMSRDAPIRHGKKVIYPNPKSLPQQNLWEFVQSNYFNNSIDDVMLTDSTKQIEKNSISPNSFAASDKYNRSPLSISPTSKGNLKSIMSEKDDQNSSPSKKYGKPEIVSRKLKKIVLPAKVITYKHRPRAKLTKASLQYHNNKHHTNEIENNENAKFQNVDNDDIDNNDIDDDNSSDGYNGVIISGAIDTSKSANINNNIISNNTINHVGISFDKSNLMNLKRKIQNSPGKSVRNDLNSANIDRINASNTNNNADDSSDEGIDYDSSNNGLSTHLDEYHNLSESLEKSYIEEFPDQKGDPSLHFDNVEVSEVKPIHNSNLNKDVKEEVVDTAILPDSKENSLLKEQADELEEERRVRATLEARLQESRIMLQILAGQNLRTYHRRKSHQDIDVLEKTIEGVGEVLSVIATDSSSPTIKATISPKPSSIRKANSATPPKVITSIRRTNNNSTPVISISLSHLLGDIEESEPQTGRNVQVQGIEPDIINSNSSKEGSQKIHRDVINSQIPSDNHDESQVTSEKSKSGSIFNSLLSVFQRKKTEELKKGDLDLLQNSSPKLEEELKKEDIVDNQYTVNVTTVDDNDEAVAAAAVVTVVTSQSDNTEIDNFVVENEGSVKDDFETYNEKIDETTEPQNSKTPLGKFNNDLHVDTNQFLSPIDRNLSLALTPSQFRDISLDDLGITLDNSNKSSKTADLLQLLALDPIILRKALLLGKSLPEIYSLIKMNDNINSINDDHKLHEDDISKPSKIENYYLPFLITLKSQELRRNPFQIRISHEDIPLFTLFQIYGKMEGGILVTHIRLSNITKALQDVKILGASLLSDKKIETLLRKIPFTTNKPNTHSVDGSTFISPTASKNSSKKVMSINSNALLSPQFSKQYSFDQFKHILSTIVPVIIKSAINNENGDVDLQIFETIKLSIKLWLLSPSTFSNSTYKQTLDDSKVCLSGLIKCVGNPLTPTLNTKVPNSTSHISPKRKSIMDVTDSDNDVQLWGCSVNLDQIKSIRSLWEKNIEQLKNIFIGYGTSTVGQRSASPSNNPTSNINITTFLSFDECREMLIDFDVIPDILDQQTLAKIFRSCKLWEWYIVASLGSRHSIQDDNTSTTVSDDTQISPKRRNIQNFQDFLLQEQHNSGSYHQQLLYYLPNLSNYNDSENDINSSVGSFNLTFLGLVELFTRIACFGGRLGTSPRIAVENLLRIMNSSNGKYKLANSRKKKVTCTRNFVI